MQSTLELLRSSDPDIHAAMLGEEERERSGLELIPSENYAFPEVYATNGSVFANKYNDADCKLDGARAASLPGCRTARKHQTGSESAVRKVPSTGVVSVGTLA